MRISPKYRDEDWQALKLSSPGDWNTAVAIFEDRMRGRFLDFVDAIESHKYAGFAVLAIDCLLIETLQQFRKGEPETPYKKGKQYFQDFLTETFKEDFDTKTAGIFYEHIRNGILHQAEVKQPSLIQINKKKLVETTPDGKGLIIDRKRFHAKLKQVFEEYLTNLRCPETTLREPFWRKMDSVCKNPVDE
jgi:hypothetical protein